MNNEALVHAYNPLRERLMGTKLQDRKERKYSFLLDTMNEKDIKIGQQWMRNDTRAIKTVKDVSPAGMVLLLNGRMKNKICENTLLSDYTLLD